MSAQQPEALRLAAILDHHAPHRSEREAAAELRRLHALNLEWQQKAATWLASPAAAQRLDGYRELAQRLNAAEQQRDALLEALKVMVDNFGPTPSEKILGLGKARAAISKAGGSA